MDLSYEERAVWYDVEQTLLDDRQYLRLFIEHEGTSILEIPCASGRNISWLGELNKRVVVGDSSPKMLEVCQAKIDKSGSDIRTFLTDMEEIQLEEQVDTIVVPQDGFLLLSGPTSMLKALRSIRENLSVSGAALIDVPLLEKCKRTARESPLYFDVQQTEGIEAYEWSRLLPNGNMLMRWRTQRKLVNSDRYRLDFRYEVRGLNGQTLGDHNSSVELAIVSVDLMTDLFGASGLKIEAIHQNYEGSSLSEGACRAIFRVRK